MAAQWGGRGEGHAVNCPGTTLHAVAHVRQCGQVRGDYPNEVE